MPSLKLFSLGVLILGLAQLVLAGHYEAQGPNNPSGGTMSMTSGSVSYGFQGVYYGAETEDYFVNCAGTITTVYTWVPDNQWDLPPSEAVVVEECNTYASASSSLGFMIADAGNGLGFSTTYTLGSDYAIAHSSGVRYKKVSAGATFTITCNPFASAASDEHGNYAVVQYRSHVLVPYVSLIGVTRFTNQTLQQFLTGQQISSSIAIAGSQNSFAPLSVSSRSWKIESDPTGDKAGVDHFKEYIAYAQPGSPYFGEGRLVKHSSADLAQPTFSFYTIRRSKARVKCDLALTIPQDAIWAGGTPTFTAQSQEVLSVRPKCTDWMIDDGTVTLIGDSLQFGAGSSPGQRWTQATINVPAPWAQAGTGAFCQLFKGTRNVHRLTTPPWPSTFVKFPWNAEWTIDGAFPAPQSYAPSWQLPSQGAGFDIPNQYLYGNVANNDQGGQLWDLGSVNDSMETWVIYMPPAVGNQQTTWIPLAHYTWGWSALAQRPGGTGSWQISSGASGKNNDLSKDYFLHPQWTLTTPTPFWTYP